MDHMPPPPALTCGKTRCKEKDQWSICGYKIQSEIFCKMTDSLKYIFSQGKEYFVLYTLSSVRNVPR